jgi:hypothetical protein
MTGIGGSMECQSGLEFGVVIGENESTPRSISLSAVADVSYTSTGFENTMTYEVSGQDALEAIQEGIDIVGGLSSTKSTDTGFTVSNMSHANPMGEIFETIDQLQSNESGEAIVSYTLQRSSTATISGLDFNIAVTPSGTRDLKVSLAAGASFEETNSFDSLVGKWITLKHYPTEEYPTPNFTKVYYGDLLEDVCDRVPLSVKIAAFVYNYLCPFCGSNKSATDSLSWPITDSSGVDTTGFLLYRLSSFPDTLSSVRCYTWGWWGSSPLSEKQDLNSRSSDIYSRLKAAATEARGMDYGYGGFYQFEPFGLPLEDTTYLIMPYLQSEIEGFSESELAMYREDKANQSWIFVGGTIDTITNTVTAKIDQLGTYSLAPRIPYGAIELDPSPTSIPADGISTSIVTSDTIRNNDGSVVQDSMEFNVFANGGAFLTLDPDTLNPGLQVYSWGGIIEFTLQSIPYGQVVQVSAQSTYGSAYGETEITLVDANPPSAPSLLTATPEGERIHLTWSENTEMDIKGYKIYYDIDGPGTPYDGEASIFGKPSPVDVGDLTTYTLTGLTAGTQYWITITACDVAGNEGAYSNELATSTLSCVCDCHADPACDGVTDIFDVTHVINVAFRNGAPMPDSNTLCPRVTTDVNCDGVTDIFDVVHMVNVAFRNGNPATEICDPCP